MPPPPHPPERESEDTPDPGAEVGAHRLGPHVVGQRVVVRRLFPGETGPSGGPAMTDVLGTCTGWAGGTCTVETADGTTVRIATAEIVSGKPVPPRPSPRLRVSAATAQRHAMSLFPDLETRTGGVLGAWVARRSPGHEARRANSVLAMGEVPDLDAAHDAVVAFYAARGRRPVAAVSPGTDAERTFLERGWVPESEDPPTVFMLSGVAAARRALAADGVVVPDDVRRETEGERLVAVHLDDRAAGVGALDGDWAGLRSIAVAPAHRRRGLGRQVVAALLEWAAERGATTAYLQVLGHNAGAIALYEKAGFTEHHRYRYLAQPR